MDLKVIDRGIRAVGFDLDKTLYKPDGKASHMIEKYVIQKAHEILGIPTKEIKEGYKKLYDEKQSVRRSLLAMGIPEGAKIAQEAIAQANIAQYLKEDPKLVELMRKLHEEYELYLITSSKKDDAISKLNALGISETTFSIPQYGRTDHTREDGSAFRYVATTLGISLEQMMFVGDREQVDIVPANSLNILTALVNGEPRQKTVADYRLKEIYSLDKILLQTT